MAEYIPIEKHSIDIIQTLKRSRIFQRLPEPSFSDILPIAQLHAFQEGEFILKTGEENYDVYFLIKGRVSILSGDEKIHTLKRAGDVFGEMSILSHDHYCSADVIADRKVQVLSIHTRHFGNSSPKALHQLFSIVLAEKLRITTEKARKFEKTNIELLQAKLELQSMHHELKQRYKELKRELTRNKVVERERTELEVLLHQSQKMDTLGTLSQGVAHSFHHFLSLIMGHVEMARLESASSMSYYFDKILDACQQASGLSQQILTFNVAMTTKLELLNLASEVDTSLQVIRAALPSNIDVHAYALDEHSCVAAHSTQIHQILVCLCLNAAHAMLKSGGLLEITLRKATDEQFSLQENKHGYLELSIRDTGHGMPEKIQNDIFQPFFSTKKDNRAVGLGLSMVQGIVHQYQGIIRVESEVNQGSTFRVYLPICHTLKPTQVFDFQKTPPDAQEAIVFIAAKDELFCLYQKYLMKLGYDVSITHDLERAEALLKQEKTKLMILDARHLQGCAIKRDRLLDLCQAIPIIVMTDTHQAPLHIPCSQWLPKPIGLQQLRLAVLKVLQA